MRDENSRRQGGQEGEEGAANFIRNPRNLLSRPRQSWSKLAYLDERPLSRV